MSTMEGKLADITVAETTRHAEGAPICPSQVAEANTELASVSPLIEAPASEVPASTTSAQATSMEQATAALKPAKSGLAASAEPTAAMSHSETSRNLGSTQASAAYAKRQPQEASQSAGEEWGFQDPVLNIDSLNELQMEIEADERNEAQDTSRRTVFSDQDTYQLAEPGATAIQEAGRVFCTDIINTQVITYSPYQVVYEKLDLKWTLLEDYWHDDGVIYEKTEDKEDALILTGTKANKKIVSGIGRLDVSTFQVTRTYVRENEEYHCDTIGTYRDRNGDAHLMQVNIAFRLANRAMTHGSTLFYNLQVSGLQLIHTPSNSTARN